MQFTACTLMTILFCTEARVISRSVCDGLMLNVLEEQSSTLCPKHSSVVPGYLVENTYIYVHCPNMY